MTDDEETQKEPSVPVALRKRKVKTVSVESYRAVRSGKFGIRREVIVRPHVRRQEVVEEPQPQEQPGFFARNVANWQRKRKARREEQDKLEAENAERKILADYLEGGK